LAKERQGEFENGDCRFVVVAPRDRVVNDEYVVIVDRVESGIANGPEKFGHLLASRFPDVCFASSDLQRVRRVQNGFCKTYLNEYSHQYFFFQIKTVFSLSRRLGFQDLFDFISEISKIRDILEIKFLYGTLSQNPKFS